MDAAVARPAPAVTPARRQAQLRRHVEVVANWQAVHLTTAGWNDHLEPAHPDEVLAAAETGPILGAVVVDAPWGGKSHGLQQSPQRTVHDAAVCMAQRVVWGVPMVERPNGLVDGLLDNAPRDVSGHLANSRRPGAG